VNLTAILATPQTVGADRTPAGAAARRGDGDFASLLTDALNPGRGAQQPAPAAEVHGAPLDLTRQPDNAARATLAAPADDPGPDPDRTEHPDPPDHPDHASDPAPTPEPSRLVEPDRPPAGPARRSGTDAVYGVQPLRSTEAARATDPTTRATDPTTRAADPTTRVAEPTRVVDPTRVVEPITRVVGPTRVAEPTRVVDPTRVAEPTRVVDPTRATDPTRVAEPTRVVDPTRATGEVAPNRPTSATAGVEAAAVLPVGRPHNGMDGLDPTFRHRLERVIDRMQREHGHHVVVNETLRSQERQEWLHAQGRTRPGPIVTWTLNSNHSTGRAADLIIDGSYRNPAGYARLAQVAAEEGLHTLGARDPGHVELPDPALAGRRSARAAAPHANIPANGVTPRAAPHDAPGTMAPAASQPVTAAGVPGVGRVANVAAVAAVAATARVAAVASTAAVARVASPGRPAAPTVQAEQRDRDFASAVAAARTATLRGTAAVAASATGDRDAGSHERAPSESASASVASNEAAPDGRAMRSSFMDALVGLRTAGADPLAGAAAPVDMAGRIARLMQARDVDAARPLSSILLRLDNATGGEDRIRVDLRGAALDASLELGDQATARRADAHLHELRAALARNGLDPNLLRVRTSMPEAMDVGRAAAAAAVADEIHRTTPSRPDPDAAPQRRPAGDDAAPEQDARPDSSDEEPWNNQKQGDLT
jgi:hypothetical protein